MKKLALLPFCLLLVVRPATARPAAAPKPAFYDSDGLPTPASRQPRQVAPFAAVDVAGSMNVVLRQGSPQRVEVEASDADQAKVETAVDGGRLRVGQRREGRSFFTAERFEGRVTVYVTAPSLTAVSVSGSGDLRVEGPVQAGDFRVSVAGSGNLTLPQLTAQALKTSLAGSGNITVGGSCPRQSISIQGSGDVKAADLRTDDTTVRIAGSGSAHVHAAKTLTSSIAGSGDVVVSGNPQISSSKSGSGSVRRI